MDMLAQELKFTGIVTEKELSLKLGSAGGGGSRGLPESPYEANLSLD